MEDGDYGEEPAAEEGDESDDDWMVVVTTSMIKRVRDGIYLVIYAIDC